MTVTHAPSIAGQPMRILLLVTGLQLGGAEQQVAALARQFAALHHAVAVLSLTPDCAVDLPRTATVVSLDMRKTPWSMAQALWRARAFVHAWQPDVIHAHMVHANLFARVLAALFRVPPVICTAHSAREGGHLRMLAYRLTDRWASLTTHVSAQGRQAMIDAGAVAPGRITVVPNGIDTGRYALQPEAGDAVRSQLGMRQHERLIVNVGRLVPEKAQDLLIDAFALLAQALKGETRVRLLIAGGGPEHAALVRRIEHHQLQELVSLAGPRHDIPELLNAADLFVLSSRIEGMPLALGEALACGCAVVATDAPGVKELLGADGTMVARGDVRALATAMQDALATGRGDLATQRRRHQRIRAEFGLEAIAGRWLDSYRNLANTIAIRRVEAA